jgi:tRNA threonylcarbamoyladenosine biosynthesis protein TsaE
MIAMHLGLSGIMPGDMELTFTCNTTEDTKALARSLGGVLRGGEVLAFHSDLGGGKTAFVKGLAVGMGVTNVVQSPTFTLSLIHEGRDGLESHHYDFYRLTDAGVMAAELAESLAQQNAVVAVEWGDIVHNILPPDCIQVTLRNLPEGETRSITIAVPFKQAYIIEALKNYQQKKPV